MGCSQSRCQVDVLRPQVKGWVSGWPAGWPDTPREGWPARLGARPQDEDKPEDEMAQKRASLLERQQRRAEEARRRKQWQEAEREQRREEAAR